MRTIEVEVMMVADEGMVMPLTPSIMATGACLLGTAERVVSCDRDVDVADNMAGVGQFGVSSAGHAPRITASAL